MAIPLALVELAAEGLILFRRVLSTYNSVNSSIESVESLLKPQSAVDNDLRFHRVIPGEEIYLFILLKESYADFKKYSQFQSRWTEDEIDDMIAAALIQSLKTRPAADLDSVIIHLCFTFGAILQKEEPMFYDFADDFITNQVYEIQLADPVKTFIWQEEGKLTPQLEKLVLALNVPASILTDVYASREASEAIRHWISYPDIISKRSSRYSKTQTILGYIIRGAESTLSTGKKFVDITKGPDAFRFRLLCITPPQPVIYARKRNPMVSSLTKDLIDTASRRETMRQGFVLAVDDDNNRLWMPRDQTDVRTATPADMKPDTIRKPKVGAVTGAVSSAKAVKSTASQITSVFKEATNYIAKIKGKNRIVTQ